MRRRGSGAKNFELDARADRADISGVTPEQKHQAIEAARAAGIDLEMLETNLELSVKERWAQHDAALEFAEKLVAAKKAADAQLWRVAEPAR